MADNLTREQRRHCMSSVRNRDTDIEQALRAALHRKGYRFRKHVRELPGSPDIVFSRSKVAVFVDGDFWHGYQLSKWSAALTEFWRVKIEMNRKRDTRNRRKLRRMGWRVLRIWQHQVEANLLSCVDRIEGSL